MFPWKWTCSFALCLLICCAWAAPASAKSEVKLKPESEISPVDRLPPGELRDKLKEMQQLKAYPEQRPVRRKGIPWVDASGERLVAVVEDRTLTKSQMDERVNLLLKSTKPYTDPQMEEDRKVLYESQIVEDWANLTAMAVIAGKLGYTVSDEEVNKEIESLSKGEAAAETPSANAPVSRQAQLVGIPESALRQELHDSLLVEKMVQGATKRFFNEEAMRDLFKKSPKVFLDAPEYRAYQMYSPLVGGMAPKDRERAYKELSGLRGKFRKCKTTEDLVALKKKLGADSKVIVSDMGWVLEGTKLPQDVMESLASLKPGETSEVVPPYFPKAAPDAYYVVKLLERKSGSPATFESARPQIENYLYGVTKEVMTAYAPTACKISKNPAGLTKWLSLDDPNTKPAPKAAKAGTAASTSTLAAKRATLPTTATTGVLQSGAPPKPKLTPVPTPVAKRKAPRVRDDEANLFGEPPSVEETLRRKMETESN